MKNGNDARLVQSQDRKYTKLEYDEPTDRDHLDSDPIRPETVEQTNSNQRAATRNGGHHRYANGNGREARAEGIRFGSVLPRRS